MLTEIIIPTITWDQPNGKDCGDVIKTVTAFVKMETLSANSALYAEENPNANLPMDEY